MAFANTKKFTIQNGKVGGASGDLTSFPVLVSGIFDGSNGNADFRVTGSGGDVQNVDTTATISTTDDAPADLAFFDDVSGTTEFDYECVFYNSTTGQFIAYVRIPTLSKENDTDFFIHYNDAAVTVSQESIGAVWEANYQGVWHLIEASGTRFDSSGNGNDLTDNNTVTQEDGKIFKGAVFIAANTEYLSIADASQTGLDFGGGDHSFSFWISEESRNADGGGKAAPYAKQAGSVHGYFSRIEDDGGGNEEIELSYSSDGTGPNRTRGPSDGEVIAASDTFTHLAITTDVSATTFEVYSDSTSVGHTNVVSSATSLFDSSDAFELGRDARTGQLSDITLESFRAYGGVLTQDWITTEFNSTGDPGTFYVIEGVTEPSGVLPNGQLTTNSKFWGS